MSVETSKQLAAEKGCSNITSVHRTLPLSLCRFSDYNLKGPFQSGHLVHCTLWKWANWVSIPFNNRTVWPAGYLEMYHSLIVLFGCQAICCAYGWKTYGLTGTKWIHSRYPTSDLRKSLAHGWTRHQSYFYTPWFSLKKAWLPNFMHLHNLVLFIYRSTDLAIANGKLEI